VSDEPLASDDATDEAETEETVTKPAAPTRPPAPTFKFSTFLLTFLFVMGLYMLFDNNARITIAEYIGAVLVPLIGFGGQYLLLTMFLAAVIEMLITALAYNWATDWVKAARVQKWNQAFRKVQSAALKSGKKDRVEALKVHQQTLTKLSSEVSMAQLKGMAVTWFHDIAIYTWVGLFIQHYYQTTVNGAGAVVSIGGASANLYLGVGGIAFLPLWFLLFSLYTIPSSIALRRVLKHYWLRRYAAEHPPSRPDAGAVGGGA
jgi:uncharacterized membrane protein (DUF106 family)